MANHRIVLFDALKVILSIMVINVHYESVISGKPFSPFFYLGRYAVPLFIIISFYFNANYFLYKSSCIKTFQGKFKRLCIPLLFWSVIGFLIQPNLLSFRHILRQLILGTVVDGPLYYLNILIMITLLWLLLKQISGDWFRLVLAGIILFMLVIDNVGINQKFVNFFPYSLQFEVTRLMEFIPYAAIGTLLPSLLKTIKGFDKRWLLFPILVTTLGLDIYNNWHSQTDAIVYSGVLQFCSATIIIILLVLYQDLHVNEKISKIVFGLGKYVLGIYCLHFFFIQNLSVLYQHSSYKMITYQITIVCIVFILCFVISFIMKKVSAGRLIPVVS